MKLPRARRRCWFSPNTAKSPIRWRGTWRESSARPASSFTAAFPLANARNWWMPFNGTVARRSLCSRSKPGGTGLNLTAASHVIHFDRWWNPAVENQATDRAFRIGQKRNVMVHKFTCRGTLEERIHEVIAGKSALAEDVLGEGGERLLTEMNNSELLRFVALDINATAED